MAVTAEQLIKQQGARRKQFGPVIASDVLYSGTLVFVDASTGYLTSDDDGGANAFFGIAYKTYDNSSGASGDIQAECWRDGDFELIGSGFTQATNGAYIYATDNYTVTGSATSATYIGGCARFVSSTRIVVSINPLPTFDGTGS